MVWPRETIQISQCKLTHLSSSSSSRSTVAFAPALLPINILSPVNVADDNMCVVLIRAHLCSRRCIFLEILAMLDTLLALSLGTLLNMPLAANDALPNNIVDNIFARTCLLNASKSLFIDHVHQIIISPGRCIISYLYRLTYSYVFILCLNCGSQQIKPQTRFQNHFTGRL